MPLIAADVATWMGVVPLAVVAYRSSRRPVDVAFWWLALAFAVSFLADTAARWLNPWSVTFVYVISQAALVAFVFLPRRDAVRAALALCAVGLVAPFVLDARGRDYVLHVAGWSGATWVAWRHAKGRLQTALLLYFGAGVVAYVIYARWANWPTWLAYQTTRALGIGLFAWAVWKPGPVLKVTP